MTSVMMSALMMMVVMTCSSHPTPGDEKLSTLPVPKARLLTIEEPTTLIVKWIPVKADPNNPILGYKVKLWEDKEEEVDTNANATVDLQAKTTRPVPNYPPAFIVTVPADATSAKFDNLKLGVHYQIRLQTYNEQGESEYSSAQGIGFNQPIQLKDGNDEKNV